MEKKNKIVLPGIESECTQMELYLRKMLGENKKTKDKTKQQQKNPATDLASRNVL